MTHYFTIPGYKGSGPDHWQTCFENTQTNFSRIHQNDWHKPNVAEWAVNIDKALAVYPEGSVILVAHSLGCFTVAEWARQFDREIKGALLVAPPAIDNINNELIDKIFEEQLLFPLPFPTVLVGSTNDPWISKKKVEFYAQSWGSKYVNIGEAGHINVESGFGDWKQGLEILESLK